MSFEAFARIVLTAICLGLMLHDVHRARTAERARLARVQDRRRHNHED